MSIFSRLAEKSWLTPGADYDDPTGYRPSAGRVAMVVYFVVATVIFGLVSSAYVMRMGMPGMGHGPVGDWRPMPEPPLLWVNTGILLLASLAWEAARSALRRGRVDGARGALIGAGLLGLAFLAGQLLLWRQYGEAGYYLQSNPANSFFYLITGLHGAHLIAGLFFWLRAYARAGDRTDAFAAGQAVDVSAAYWHFLLLVWLVMLGLLVST
ncbi:MAG TPA: cytochrome c oxidase subunit 3 [Allosphingosinicella sp.]